MNKNALLFIGILLAVIGGSFAFLAAKPEMSISEKAELMTQTSSPTQSRSTATTQSTETKGGGVYTDYNEESFASASGQRVLFFYAPWCGQCRQLDGDMKKGPIPAGYTILKVDFDSNQDLRKKYGVTFRTAYVKIDANGNRIDKPYIAYDEPTFAAVKRDFL